MDKEIKEILERIAKAIEEVMGATKEYLGDGKYTQMEKELEECRELMWKVAEMKRLSGE